MKEDKPMRWPACTTQVDAHNFVPLVCFLSASPLPKSARAYMTLCYTADDSARGNPSRGFFGRSVRGVSKWVDESALALSWKVRVLDFDEHSPIKSTTLVTALVALTAMAVTKKAVNIAMR